jgi:hypothetical protein
VFAASASKIPIQNARSKAAKRGKEQQLAISMWQLAQLQHTGKGLFSNENIQEPALS